MMEDRKALLDRVFGYYNHGTARREALMVELERVVVREH